jgi:hypothetical protein
MTRCAICGMAVEPGTYLRYRHIDGQVRGTRSHYPRPSGPTSNPNPPSVSASPRAPRARSARTEISTAGAAPGQPQLAASVPATRRLGTAR